MRIPTSVHGIIGYPLGHSLSPRLHNWGFAEHGIDSVYVAFPLRPEKIEDFVTSVRTLPLHGVSVTIPHKRTVMLHLDGLSERARAVGAVNTLYWSETPGESRLLGENTDVAGFLAPLQERNIGSALVLGAGGAARAALAGLVELGFETIYLANRTLEIAQDLAKDFPSISVVPWDERGTTAAALVVNATPLGMTGRYVNESPFPQDGWTSGQIAYDMVYNPLETVFLHEARSAGSEVIDGLSMFLAQGAEQFRLWTGKELDLTAARPLLLEALGA